VDGIAAKTKNSNGVMNYDDEHNQNQQLDSTFVYEPWKN